MTSGTTLLSAVLITGVALGAPVTAEPVSDT